MKPGVPVVYDASCEESRTVIEARAMELKCPKIPVGRDAYTFMKTDAKGAYIAVRTSDGGQLVVTLAVPGGISADERFCRSDRL